ncbi:hypothetical protein NARC_10359 [Candidatus Nitrosocosmicus arcticus]|uniref:Uncharacterized protein n=1 Tax=Candidatus Nitrosocosmicus arcticus TaxID=2035267 RepID=A0A557SZC4_9ARCH|nr:hypothetical protein NARC_10359 [Candidatus Nitrosocosmicus arcticus]
MDIGNSGSRVDGYCAMKGVNQILTSDLFYCIQNDNREFVPLFTKIKIQQFFSIMICILRPFALSL